MIYTAYFDETDTHGDEPTVIMAGYLGHAYQWQRFGVKLARLQQAYGFKTFHTTEYKASQGEFRGWSDEKRSDLLNDLIKLVSENLTEGLAIALERARYETEYRAEPIPRKMNLDSQYGACFRACLGRIFQALEHRGNRDTLNVVMENGHKNVGDCGRIFTDLKSRFDALGTPLLGTFTVATKDESPPLMAADMLAGAYSMIRAANEATQAELSDLPPAGSITKGRLAFIELDVDALRQLKVNFDELRRLQAEAWRERRAARIGG